MSPDVPSGPSKVALPASTAGVFRLSAIHINVRIYVRLRPRRLEGILTVKLPPTMTEAPAAAADTGVCRCDNRPELAAALED